MDQQPKPKPDRFSVDADVFNEISKVLTSLPYQRVAGLVRRIEATTVPLYADQPSKLDGRVRTTPVHSDPSKVCSSEKKQYDDSGNDSAV